MQYAQLVPGADDPWFKGKSSLINSSDEPFSFCFLVLTCNDPVKGVISSFNGEEKINGRENSLFSCNPPWWINSGFKLVSIFLLLQVN